MRGEARSTRDTDRAKHSLQAAEASVPAPRLTSSRLLPRMPDGGQKEKHKEGDCTSAMQTVPLDRYSWESTKGMGRGTNQEVEYRVGRGQQSVHDWRW